MSSAQAIHLRHLANRPCISTLVTKFSQNIVADTDKNKALIVCHKCSSSFLSFVKSHPLKIPASVLEKVKLGSCVKLFLIDCMYTRDLYVLTQPHASTSQCWSDYGRRMRKWKLDFPCVLNDVCVRVNCIMANELIFSTECVFIYDQYLLT